MSKWHRRNHRKHRGHLVTQLVSRDGDRCALCGEQLDRRIRDPLSPLYVTFDHKLPRSRGGVTRPDNLQLAHSRCNSLRGNDPLLTEDGTQYV